MSCVYAGRVCCTVASAKSSGGERSFSDTSLKYWPAFFPAAPDQNMMTPGNVVGTATRALKSMRIRLKDRSFTRVALVQGRRVLLLESLTWS